MPRLRVFLAWIVLLALPLQGMTAASMLFCGPPGAPPEAGHHQLVGQGGEAQHPAEGASPHEAAGAAGSTHADSAETPGANKCSVCAACSHSVGITGPAITLSIAKVPQFELATVLLVMRSHTTGVGDRPPRA